MHSLHHGDKIFTVGTILFAGSMVLLYLFSTIYHALPSGKTKQVFRVIEHSAIFLLIAGTYTPLTLGVLRGPWGWTLLWLVWGLAITGVLMKVFDKMFHPFISLIFYLLMGWLVLIAIKPLYTLLPASGMLWLVAGGLAYTIGVVFYALGSRRRYCHFIWHLFVIAGTTCHYFAVLWYAA